MLTVTGVNALRKPGRYADRDGLYLQVNKTGTKSWIYRYQINGRRREMGLGSLKKYSLKEARTRAFEAAKLKEQGIDPKVIKDTRRAETQDNNARTFKACALAYIEENKAGWRNEKHASQWINTLEAYAFPTLGDLPVDQINTTLVLEALKPIWQTKTETATRVRGRIENVLSWAIVHGYREGPNPALWRGHLELVLPQRNKIQKPKHHAALPYTDLPEFMKKLRGHKSLSALALQFTILTAARTGEVIGADWKEIDLRKKVWIIPADRMKAEQDHRKDTQGPTHSRRLAFPINPSGKTHQQHGHAEILAARYE
ncbi:MAG: tyrosine-type recombinase/integrase [bacterium]